MSSYSNPQQYNVDPPPGKQPYQQQPYQQPPVQPYVEQGPPPMQGGGQPPYQPPGGYTPGPPPPPRGKGGRIAIASILSVALLLGVGAFVFFKFVWTSGPDPAERFPASASMYVELNLDPSFDQTPKLLEHLSKFEGIDYDDGNDIFADLLDEAGLEGVEAERDLSSWLGRRHGFAMWEYEGAPYGVINLASTDADAAESGLDNIRESAGATDDQWAYTVSDDSVLMVVGESGAADALTAAETEAGDSPLSDTDAYDEARSWLDGDQLLVYWVDVEAVYDLAEAFGGASDIAAFESMYTGHVIVGVSAFDDGFEMTYRGFGDTDDPWTGSEDLLDNMGELPAGHFAATAEVPDNLAEITEEWAGELEDSFGGESDSGSAIAGAPLTDEEYAEYEELSELYWEDDLTDEQQSRYDELDDRYWEYGTEEYPWGEETDDYSSGPDFDEMFGSLEEALDLLSGAQLSIAGSFGGPDDVDPESLFFSALLAEDRAEELNTLINDLAGDELPEGVEVDGSKLSFQGGDVPSSTLSEDPRFSSFAEAAPDQVGVGVWVDMAALIELESAGLEELEPLSAIAWAHGSEDGDGTGLLRVYID